ncbi:MAG TPA: DUF4129 domain-containing protein [Rhodopirellula baltica]|uniref:Protein-glutamine gamma-glutamyltransferase-like C-terminal domain-containing protein n=2 Tax=Rhodopirellula baltica TaxID=265606 RepID=Q7UIK7_RHOBA|nr:DUF4129 domain-containing protein [Rhodopirellula baltica]EKJ99406.1 hypothetical protein RBSH_05290 [Rhodopirellula baltica SH28]CAD77607.1 hypothetical protein-signal peptide and transmembrane prediction [Rhodopirellula baltica SH 1]HBE61540.1 DUF4129 domain-containing protein [Rhodopirellula baltica]
MSRLHHTAADYAAIAIAPVLIFVMLFSLASFLCIVLYSGGYSGALVWTMLMYSMGATAVARITIENDRQYSSLYAIALGIATVYVLVAYVGDPIFSIGIVWIVGYLADKIVHDCTIVDDSIDSSGQGLVDSGLSFLKLRRQQHQTALSPSTSEADDADASSKSKRPRKNPAAGHQPGRTVLWLALGALPLFGLGQFFLGGDSKSWNLARILLTLYLFSALSLLVVTSFLNLRRYLRQRQTEMPLDATIAWLAGGIVIIGLILMIAYIAPLPGKAVASMKAPEFLTNRSPMSASEYGWGDEGAEISDENDARSSETGPDGSPSGETQSGAKAGGQKGNREDGPAGSDPGGKKQGKGQDPGGDQPAGGEKNKSSENQSTSGDSKSSGNQQQTNTEQNNQPSQNQSQQNQSSQSANESSSDSSPPSESKSEASNSSDDGSKSSEQDSSKAESDSANESESPKNESADQSKQNSDQSKPNNEQSRPQSENQNQNANQQEEPLSARTKPPPNRSPPLSGVFSVIAGMLKWLIFLGLFAFIAIFIFRNLDAIMAWWDSLFAEEDRETTSQLPSAKKLKPETPPRPFSSFRNPVGDPDPRKVVVVTFQALEAWCREQGVERSPDETPSEFVRRVAVQFPSLGQSAIQVVDAYNRIVYGRAAAAKDDVEAASSVWQVFAGGIRTS